MKNKGERSLKMLYLEKLKKVVEFVVGMFAGTVVFSVICALMSAGDFALKVIGYGFYIGLIATTMWFFATFGNDKDCD